jgi:hypothetical protein
MNSAPSMQKKYEEGEIENEMKNRKTVFSNFVMEEICLRKPWESPAV